MSALPSRAIRHIRQHEGGFTLIEAMVSIALLVLITGIIGVMYGVGFTDVFNRGGAEGHITATSNLIQLQQLVSEDIQRASCVTTAGTSNPPGCAALLARCQPSDLLCLGWAVVASESPFALGCQVVRYDAPANGRVQRQVWSGGAAAGSVSFGSAANPVAMTLQASGPLLSVSLSSPGVQHNPPAASFTAQPLPTGPQLAGVDLAAAAPC